MFRWIESFRKRFFAQPHRVPKIVKAQCSVKLNLEQLETRLALAGTVVGTVADDGSANSLREVIANAAAGSTITFDPKGVYRIADDLSRSRTRPHSDRNQQLDYETAERPTSVLAGF